jgi:hypothetical protein
MAPPVHQQPQRRARLLGGLHGQPMHRAIHSSSATSGGCSATALAVRSEPIHPWGRWSRPRRAAIIAVMPCLFKLVLDVLFGREEQVAYVSVTTR